MAQPNKMWAIISARQCYWRWTLLATILLIAVWPCGVKGQAINPMMYGMGMYMNPYYTGFYGGFGNMGHMNPLGYQISSGMAIPGNIGGQGQGQYGPGGYGGGYGYGAGSHLRAALLTTLLLPLLIFFTSS